MWNPDVEGSLAGVVAYPGNPPWTLTTVATTYLVVVDAYLAGDRFEVFNNAVSLGETSPFTAGAGDCAGGNLPENCLADATHSRGVFTLAPGSQSITLAVSVNPYGSGAGFFSVMTTNPLAPTLPPVPPSVPSVPEPSTMGMVALGALGIYRRWAKAGRS